MAFKKKDFDFSAWGAFFAFSKEQLEEGLNGNPVEEYASAPGGMVVRKDNYKEMFKAFHKHCEEERQRRIKEEGLENIIKYELSNYECYYTGDISDALSVLKEYGATKEQVLKVYNEQKQYCSDF